ncbi:phosphoribosylanthranilate isomerase [Actimicrobium antarcticum]|uniref:N-(5'-phosphoribosyl)anthranilate isomerase n=1 Tax=Actimicrobium antarcticum TaxID=1051899 RepID=A0ABP7T2C5_9BURK
MVAAGADAIGFVFYAPSPRSVSAQSAATLLQRVPAFVTTVGLFVNATPDEVARVVAVAPVSLLQFHGDETPQQCAAIAAAVNRPYIRAVRVGAQTTREDLLEYGSAYGTTGTLFAGLLLDTLVDSYGGGGKVFDWSLIPEELAPQVVLSGGLNVLNATDAVTQVRPFAVDVSSGVESAKGIKDAAAIRNFIGAVRLADTLPR